MPIRKINSLSFIKRANSIYNNLFDYSKTEYICHRKPIIIICKIHGEWVTTPQRHLSGRGGCPKCHPNSLISNDEFIRRCKKYSKNISYEKCQYKNMKNKVILTCLIHGDFEQKAQSHIEGGGCKLCNAHNEVLNSFENFLTRANIVHNNKFIYDFNYDDYVLKTINIICPTHGLFKQNRFNHLNGMGCKKCAVENQKFTYEEFIEKSNIIHKNKYDYSKVVYIKSGAKVCIICKNHGEFWQTPSHHFKGVGCVKCSHTISKKEIQWLNDLHIPQEFRNKFIVIGDRLYKPDAVDIENKIIYEFYGDFWHGNPNIYDRNKINKATKTTFGQLYDKTIEKEKLLLFNKWKVISIWEKEFNENKCT